MLRVSATFARCAPAGFSKLRNGETQAQAFARIYAENPNLAAKERLQNRPGAGGVRVVG
jgi:hypothetical protein